MTSLEDAQLIIAHSGGWLMLKPEDYTNKKLTLIDPAYRDEHSLRAKSLNRLKYDAHHTSFGVLPGYIYRRILNSWYFITLLPRWLDMFINYKKKDISDVLGAAEVTIVRASDSAWFNPVVMAEMPDVRTLPGDHDACWHRPKELADILGL